MELLALVFLSFCFLTLSGLTFGAEFEPTVVVKEGDSAILPCSLNTNVNIESALFDWKKVEQHSNKEVFLYDKADVYSNGRPGQVEQFKGRVSHFPEELEHGNASIRIENTKVADSGNYTCEFPRIQPEKIFHIELIVGAAPEPVVSILDGKGLLECRVKGAFPKPTVEWWDSSNKTVPSDKKEISEREHRFYITLQTTVSNTGRYRCVTTQEEIHHQISTDTFVALNEKMEPPTQGGTIYVMIGVIVVLVILFFVAVYFAVRHNVPSVCQKDGVHEQTREGKDIPLVNTQSKQE